MKSDRRTVAKALALAAAGMLLPIRLLAARWNKAAFEADDLSDSLRYIGAGALVDSDRIHFKAPEIAENGSIVPIEIESRLPDTETIYVLAEKNPEPLVASYTFLPGAEAFVATRIKMGESAKLMIVVKAGSRYFSTSRFVKVTIGGCGPDSP